MLNLDLESAFICTILLRIFPYQLIRLCVNCAVETARRYFPCYSAVIDKYVLDDDYVEPNDEGNIEEQLLKKRHFAELKDILQDSFPKAKVDEHKKMEKLKIRRIHDAPSSSSSTSSSRGTSDSMVTRMSPFSDKNFS